MSSEVLKIAISWGIDGGRGERGGERGFLGGVATVGDCFALENGKRGESCCKGKEVSNGC